MKKHKVLLSFVKLSIPVKIAFYKNVISCLKNNPEFAKSDDELNLLTALTGKLEQDYIDSRGGEHEIIARMYQSEEAADEAFREEARYVEKIAKGDESLILKAGFGTTKLQPGTYNKPVFGAKAGKNPGEIILTCKAIKGAKAYIWQYCIGKLPVDDKNWYLAGASTKVSYTVRDLESRTNCWFRRAPINSDSIGTWSKPVMMLVP